MLPDDHPDRIQIAFDDHRLVNNAGLILPATLALHLGLPQLVDRHLGLGRAPGRANPGDKMMTLVASALAGGDCIDDADALRTGGTAGALGCVVKAPSTLGTFLSTKVLTGILRPGDCCLLRRSLRPAGVLMGWSSRSRVAALAASSRWRTPGSRSRWPWRSIDSTRWGNAAFSRLPQIRSAAVKGGGKPYHLGGVKPDHRGGA